VLYDSNSISLAGSTGLSLSEDMEKRFESCGWHTQLVMDGNDVSAIDIALMAAKEEKARPSLIIVNTVIGFGSPAKQGTYKAHGSPLGEDEIRLTKKALGWQDSRQFFVPDEVCDDLLIAQKKGKDWESDWQQEFFRYSRSYPALAEELRMRMSGELAKGWDTGLAELFPESKPVSTRKASEAVLQQLAKNIPELMGGSADLNPSTLTWIKGGGDFESPGLDQKGIQGAVGGPWGYEGRNIHFGVREHAMAAIATGMALHGGVIPYVSTFLMFSDYMRPAIRLACLSGIRVVYIFTHDSIGVGEDGPTHQPVEHFMGLRGIPNLTVIRPADAQETMYAMKAALGRTDGPTALILSRQDLPPLDKKLCAPAKELERGGYILWQSTRNKPDLILLATGSEVHIALESARILAKEGISVRVVSLPSWEIFDQQCLEYRSKVLPGDVKARLSVEAGLKLGWEHYVGLEGAMVGMDCFGASAPAGVLFEKFGINVQCVTDAARKLLK